MTGSNFTTPVSDQQGYIKTGTNTADGTTITTTTTTATTTPTYLSKTSASSTYAPKASPTFTGTISLNGDVTLASASANTNNIK